MKKQNWEKEFDIYANKLKINSRIYNGEDYCALCGTNPSTLKEFIQKQITKAKEEAIIDFAVWLSVQKGYQNKTVMYEVQNYLKILEDKK